MKNLITSNFNLMHSNKEWSKLSGKYNISIDRNFDYYFFVLKNEEQLKKYDIFHIFLHLNENNLVQTNKKIFLLKKNLKKNLDKNIFFYFILDTTNIKRGKNNFLKIYKKLFYKFQLSPKKNVHITLFDNLDKKLFSSRNNKFLSFPFEIDIISIFRKNIVKNLLNLETKPYKLIILDCDNTLWGGVLDEKGKKMELNMEKEELVKFLRIFKRSLKL